MSKKLLSESLAAADQQTSLQVAMILESITEGFFAVNEQWQLTYINPEACRLLKCDAGDLLGKNLWTEFPGLLGSEFERLYRRVAETRIAESKVEFYADQQRWYEVRTLPIAQGLTVYFRDVTESRHAEITLFESEEFSRSIFESSPDCVKVMDVEGRLLRMNVNGMCVMEIDDFSHLEGRMWSDLWPQEGRSDVLESLEIARRGGIGRFQRFCPTAKGTARWWDVMVAPIYDSVGNVVRFVSVSRDVTEREKSEEALRQSEERLRIAVTAAKLGQWSLDLRTNVFSCSETCKTNYGRLPGEPFTYENLWESVYLADRDRVRAAIRDAIETRSDYDTEYRNVWPDGSLHWVLMRGHASYAADGTPHAMSGVTLDITVRKNAEEKLRIAEEQFRTLADNISQFAWMADESGLIYWYNQRWYDYTGTTLEEMQGWGWKAVHHPDHIERVVARIQRSWETGEIWEDTFPLLGKDGSYRWFLSRARPIHDDQGKLVRWFGTNTDITEQLETAEKLRVVAAKLSNADHRKNEFLATLAHELRNPLAPIRNGLEILKLIENDPQTLKQCLAMMERQVDQMSRLVDDLMDVSRIARGRLELRLEPLKIADVLNHAIETCRPLIDRMQHSLRVELPSEDLLINGDSVRLVQVFLNLLNNAAKYSDPGGQIHLTVRRDGQFVIVSVRDSGIGIDQDQLGSVFELFAQIDQSLEKAQGGLGIGLSLVRRLVEIHRGSVEARSDGLGKGAEFIVRLPLAEQELKPVDIPVTPMAPAALLRILIVDDNKDIANTLSMMLNVMGHTIQAVFDGAQAVTAAKEFQPDVVLLDIGLPKLNGYEACRKIRELPNGNEILIIAQTGWGNDEDRQRARDSGFDHHLTKPIDLKSLLPLLANVPGPSFEH